MPQTLTAPAGLGVLLVKSFLLQAFEQYIWFDDISILISSGIE